MVRYNSEEWIGKKINHLTVLGIGEVKSGHQYWDVECDCGNKKAIRADYVASGHSKTCGCGKRYDGAVTHGETYTRLYMIWGRMLERCNNAGYKRYNDRGIRVCDEWRSYENFAVWAKEHGYNDTLSIERIDNDGDYCPDNCKWIPTSLQARNRATTLWVIHNGTKMSLAEACEKANMPYKTVFMRMKYLGWDLEKALTIPVRKKVC